MEQDSLLPYSLVFVERGCDVLVKKTGKNQITLPMAIVSDFPGASAVAHLWINTRDSAMLGGRAPERKEVP